jgi:D-alanine-D-alanine ligase
MSPVRSRSNLPVVLLHNIDPSWPAADAEKALKETSRLASAMTREGHDVSLAPVVDTDIAGPLQRFSPDKHIVFNWCESLPGVPHSEALVPEAIESLDFVCTGSPSDVLALSEDKRRVKLMLNRADIPTPTWRICDAPADVKGWECFPAIVKAANEHCSAGLTGDSVVLTAAELHDRVAYMIEDLRQPALVEDFIDGREFHLTIWGNGTIEMLPPTEVNFPASDCVHDRLCTYDSKFNTFRLRKLRTVISPPLTEDELRRLEKIGLQAYKLIGCRDYARIDVRERDGIFHVLDINPNADITAEDSLALSAKHAGYSYGAMGSHLVSLAAQRHPGFRESMQHASA